MNITINDILKLRPCMEGLTGLYATVGSSYDKDKPLDMAALVNELSLNSICWVLGKLHKQEILLKLGVYRVKQVLHIYEAGHDSDGPRLAIEAAKNWIKSPTERNRIKASVAADAARVAAVDAAYTSPSAYASAMAITKATYATTYTPCDAYAAYTATTDFATAASDCYDDSTSELCNTQLRNYLLTLLEESKHEHYNQ